MADKYPNIPGVPVEIEDGNLVPDQPQVAARVVVVGTATKGVSKAETAIRSETGGLRRFGTGGTLSRGIAEAFQGGALNVAGYRILATPGFVKHIGDTNASAGFVLETVTEGADALEKVSVLFNNETGVLKVYLVSGGALIYSSDPEAPVDLGGVLVTGEKADDNSYGSIGLQVKVMADETSQVFRTDGDALTTLTMQGAVNLSLLQLSATNTYVAMMENNGSSVMSEIAISSVNPALGTVTLASDINILNFAEGADHKIRFVSRTKPVRADKILLNRLAVTESLEVTPGSDFNGLAPIVKANGLRVDTDKAEVGPAKMNLFEGALDAFTNLEASNFATLALLGLYADDPALDGEVSGATALPTPIVDSAVNGSEGVVDSDLTGDPTTGIGNRFNLSCNNRAAIVAALEAAGRGGAWLVITERQGDDFGLHRTEGELVRTARIMNWQTAWGSRLRLHLDRDLSFSLNDDGIVDGSPTPDFKIYVTDQLFYHRSVEVEGKTVHQWYHATTDLDGLTYHQVNPAYALAKFCHDMTANQTPVTGVIGVRPPVNHFNPANLAVWIGKSPSFDEDGNVETNGTGLLGFKFLAGKLMEGNTQFDPGFKLTEDGELDDDDLLLDSNSHTIDMGKFISIVAAWPLLTNASDATRLGYVNSGAALYAGFTTALPPWSAASTKQIGGNGIRLPRKLAKRHLNSLSGARYVVFDQDQNGIVSVVDAPSAAMATSDFQRNMTTRLVGDIIKVCRGVARPFLGEALGPIRKAGLETALRRVLTDYQKPTAGALQSFELNVTQTRAEAIAGTAQLMLALRIVNELRKLYFSVALEV